MTLAQTSAIMWRMSPRKNPGGRPSIGQSEMVWGRVSTEVRREIDELSERLDIPKSRVVAALLEVGLSNIDQAKFPKRAASQQEELPLTKAS